LIAFFTMHNLARAHLIPFARTKIFFGCEDEIAVRGAYRDVDCKCNIDHVRAWKV
jgi:hypothetical protein